MKEEPTAVSWLTMLKPEKYCGSQELGLGISAPPITYSVDGKQYVSLLVGWGGAGLISGSLSAQHGWKYKAHPRRLVTFALDGSYRLPEFLPPAFCYA